MRQAAALQIWSGDQDLRACAARLGGYRRALWAGRWRLALWCLVCVTAAAVYCVMTPAQYVASVDIAIAPLAIANDGPEDVRHFHQFDLDAQQAATELEVLRSERLLRPAFDSLGLADRAELTHGRDGLWQTLAHYLHALTPDAAPYDARQRAFLAFVNRARSLRLGVSYVFEVSYRSHDPELAARVANALAACYLADRISRGQARRERVGGAYQAVRQQDLARQWRVSRAAASGGPALAEDLFAASARILGPAAPPLGKSYPRPAPLFAVALTLGLLSGALALLGSAARDAGRS